MARITASFVIAISFVSTALTIANAFMLKKQFYPSVVYITKSNTSMAVMYFQGAVLSYLLFSFFRWIFLGQLRAAEIEHAQERVWHAVMETCLAFTVFRDDFSPKFVVQFVVLFFVKAFHWLSEDRVDYMERSPVITLLFHARIMGILALLSAVDSYFISHAYFTTLMRGASAQIVFGFETMVAHITIKYLLHMHDLRAPHPWENKAVYMLYAELLISFLRCVLYFMFAAVMIKIHTFPLFAIRPFYLTVRAFQKAVNDVVLSRRAIHAMNTLFPLATEQELRDGDNTCIICREEMTVESGAKKLPCNHIFHPNCLRSWFQRQQTCPTCRTDVLVRRQIPGGLGANAIPQAQMPQQFNPAMFFGFGQQQAQPFGVFQPPAANGAQGAPQGGQQADNANVRFVPQQGNFFGFGANAAGNQPAFVPPPMFPFMAHNFGLQPPGPRPFQPQPPPQGQPQNGAQNEDAAAQPNGGQPAGGGQQWRPTFPPFMPPPPPFAAPLPFPQPPSFAGLTDMEIAEIEGRERAAVEARIQVLRNISTLLDAAVLQFQQYTSIFPQQNVDYRVNGTATRTSAMPSAGSFGAASDARATVDSDETRDQDLSRSTSAVPTSSFSAIPPQSTSAAYAAAATAGNNKASSSAGASSSSSADEDRSETEVSPEEQRKLDEIRRRRLAKFDVGAQSNGSDNQ
ncbi:HRD-1 protein [Aphelenchoides avenae]|nr:HRD-1 protein [Aphelenchus avenae]